MTLVRFTLSDKKQSSVFTWLMFGTKLPAFETQLSWCSALHSTQVIDRDNLDVPKGLITLDFNLSRKSTALLLKIRRNFLRLKHPPPNTSVQN